MNAALDLQHQFYDMLMRSQYWSPERMLDYQRSQLSQLLRHAKKNVPFYEHRLDAVLKPNGDIDWDRWGEIPIVKRTDLLEHRDAMIARELPPGHGAVRDFSTSGSTGAPVTTTHNFLAAIAGKAATFRMHRWHQIDWSRELCMWIGDNPGAAWPEGSREGIWGPGWDPASQSGRVTFLNRSATETQTLEFLRRTGTAYLGSRPKNVQAIALRALAEDTQLRLEGAITFGTAVTPEERDDCRQAFECSMVSQYSTKEAYSIAYQCPTGPHYHQNAEIAFLEILNNQNQPCAIGETGRVVVTPLFSTAQPLIRYEQGDLATWGGPCGCGRTLSVVSNVLGRITHLFRFPDGTRVAPSIPTRYQKMLGARYWQIAQIAPLHIEVRYVPVSWGEDGDEETVATVVPKYTHADVTVSFRRLHTFPTSHGDKYIEYVCELAPN